MTCATSERRKAWLKEYRSRPEVKKRMAESKKIYRSRPEIKKKEQEYRKRYYEEHKDEFVARAREYRVVNKEEVNRKRREYVKTHREEERRYRQNNLDRHAEYQRNYRAKNPETTKAHSVINTLKRQNKITPQPCEVCGEEKVEAHHDDYNEPTKVRWLCKKCHMKWHRYNKAKH